MCHILHPVLCPDTYDSNEHTYYLYVNQQSSSTQVSHVLLARLLVGSKQSKAKQSISQRIGSSSGSDCHSGKIETYHAVSSLDDPPMYAIQGTVYINIPFQCKGSRRRSIHQPCWIVASGSPCKGWNVGLPHQKNNTKTRTSTYGNGVIKSVRNASSEVAQ